MAQALGKKDDIRRNPLAVWVGQVLQFARDRKGLTLGLLAGVLVISAAVGAYGWHRERQEREAQSVLARAHTALWGDAAGTARKPDEARKLYGEVADKYPGTVAAEEALVRLGNLQFDGSKYDEAIAAYGTYLTTYPRGRFRVMAGIGKAYAEEAKGDLVAAERTLSQLVEIAPDDPLAGEAYSTLAHVYEVMKKPDEAVRVYNQIAERFTQTHWAQNALQRMSALKTK
jgi:outer membrane protein assembly factor BamD (BamD/ComL family)